MIFGPDGHLYVPSFLSDAVLKYEGQTGAMIRSIGGGFLGTLSNPRTILFHPTRGTIIVSSAGSNEIKEYDPDSGFPHGEFVSFGPRPTGMVFGPDGLLYVTSDTQNQVWRYDGQNGSLVDTFVPAGSGGLNGGTFVFFQGEIPPPVPAASIWGLTVMGLLVATAATLLLTQRLRITTSYEFRANT